MDTQLWVALPSRRARLRLGDVLDDQGTAHLKSRLQEALDLGCARLDVDGTQVKHISTQAVADLCGAKRELEERGGKLLVRAPSWAFTRVVERTHRSDLLTSDGGAPGRVRTTNEHVGRPTLLRGGVPEGAIDLQRRDPRPRARLRLVWADGPD